MVKPWEDRTGNKVKYTGSRGLGAYLTTARRIGHPARPRRSARARARWREFARKGALKPLDDVLDIATYKADTRPGVRRARDASTARSIGVFIKSAVKGLIWYNTANFTGTAPTNWDAVMGDRQRAAPRRSGASALESGADSGWPGTDWVEDFVLRQAGPDVYDAWVAGTAEVDRRPRSRRPSRRSARCSTTPSAAPTTVNSTNFGDGGNPLFTDPPGCLFHHQASFITDFFKEQGGAAGRRVRLLPDAGHQPRVRRRVHRRRRPVRPVLRQARGQGPAEVPRRPPKPSRSGSTGAAPSPANTKVTDYPDEVSKRSAETLTRRQDLPLRRRRPDAERR